MASSVRRILVLGASSAGKTSLINQLTKQNQPVNNSANVGTLKTTIFDVCNHNGINYEFIDSAGLFQAVHGDSLSDQQIYEHLCGLLDYARSGIHLLIFVSRNGTIHQSTQDIYNLVVNVMCDKRTPVICVVTGCENEENMMDWANKNKGHFSKNGMNFQTIIGTCFAKGGRMEAEYGPLREQSSKDVWQAIEEYAPQQDEFQMMDRTSERKQQQISECFQQKRSEIGQQRPLESTTCRKENGLHSSTLKSSGTIIDTGTKVATVNNSSVDNTRQNSVANKALMTNEVRTILAKWLPKSENKWKLLYKCPPTGFNSKEFHIKCDNRGPTVTLIQSEKQFLFGGFTRVLWSSNNDMLVSDYTAFLFTITNPHNIEPTQYRMDPCTADIAVHHHPNYGPAFGILGKDLRIYNEDFGKTIVEIDFPKCYRDTTRRKSLTFASSNRFSTTDIEVYLLTDDS